MTERPPVPDTGAGQRRLVVDRLVATGDLAAGADPTDEQLRTAVRSFQQRRGLLADGVVGSQTTRALEGTRWQLGDRILLHVPGHLLAGDDVAALQQRLLELGFSCGRVDNVFGALTDTALRQLQRGVGLRPDGVAGPATLRALAQLSRSVGGGAPVALREADRVRAAGPSLAGRLVVLDPGHSGTDPGAVRGGLIESDIVLDLARRVEGRLSAVGVQVVLTRGLTGDPDDLTRAELANELGADLLVSLHTEWLPDVPQAHGVASYFYGRHDHRGAWSVTGERLATLVQSEVAARTDLLNCRAHARSWELLRRTQMPAVRVDVGHLSNAGDAHRLAEPAFRDTVAEALVIAIQRVYLPSSQDATTGTWRVADVMAQARST